VNREPTLDELIGSDTTGAERQRLQHVHELLREAGPPPELTPELEAGPNLKMTVGKRRRVVKQRAMLLLAASLALLLIFLGGYAVGDHRGSNRSATTAVSVKLTGAHALPNAQASLEVWHRRADNWPMTLTAVGLPKLAPHNYYEVYLIRDGKLAGSCGTFRVTNPKRAVTVTLNSPYTLEKGDSWIVTRPGPGGVEPGKTVLRPVTA
jgi:hypothetical protein